MKRFLIALAASVLALAPAAHADMPANWTKPTKPYRVVGNISTSGPRASRPG